MCTNRALTPYNYYARDLFSLFEDRKNEESDGRPGKMVMYGSQILPIFYFLLHIHGINLAVYVEENKTQTGKIASAVAGFRRVRPC